MMMMTAPRMTAGRNTSARPGFSRVAWVLLSIGLLMQVSADLAGSVSEKGWIEHVSRTTDAEGITDESVVLHPPGIGEPIPTRLRYRADGRPKPVFIYIHGSGPKDRIYTAWHDALAEQGMFGVSIQASMAEAARLRSLLWSSKERQSEGVVEGRRWFAFEVIRATALTVSRLIDVLPLVAEADVTRIAVGGASRGGSVANVLAWSDPRVGVVVSLIGGFDFEELLAGAPHLQYKDDPDVPVSVAVRSLIDSIDPAKGRRPAIALSKRLIVISVEKDMTPRTQIERFLAAARSGGSPVAENLRWFEESGMGHATSEVGRAKAAQWLIEFFELPEKP